MESFTLATRCGAGLVLLAALNLTAFGQGADHPAFCVSGPAGGVSNTLFRIDVDGSRSTVSSNVTGWGVEVARNLESVYFHELGKGIQRTDLDGGNPSTIASGALGRGLAFDDAERRLVYISSPDSVHYVDIDKATGEVLPGASPVLIYDSGGGTNFIDVTVDPEDGVIYVSDNAGGAASQGTVYRVRYDGTNPVTGAPGAQSWFGGLSNPEGLCFGYDPLADTDVVFIVENEAPRIWQKAVAGSSGAQTVLLAAPTLVDGEVFDVANAGRVGTEIVWTDIKLNTVRALDLVTGAISTVHGSIPEATGVSLDSTCRVVTADFAPPAELLHFTRGGAAGLENDLVRIESDQSQTDVLDAITGWGLAFNGTGAAFVHLADSPSYSPPEGDGLYKVDLLSLTPKRIAANTGFGRGIAFDDALGRVIYVDSPESIHYVDVDPLTGELLPGASPVLIHQSAGGDNFIDVAVDPAAGVIYATDNAGGEVLRMRYDGSNPTTGAPGPETWFTGFGNPLGISMGSGLNPAGGEELVVLVADNGEDPTISQKIVGGIFAGQEKVLVSNCPFIDEPFGVASLGTAGRRVFWSEQDKGEIRSYDIYTGEIAVFADADGQPLGLGFSPAACSIGACASMAFSAAYGSGTPGTLCTPQLAVSGTPIIGSTVGFTIDNCFSSILPTTSYLVFGVAQTSVPALGGTLLVAPPSASFTLATPVTGANFTTQIACEPSYCGLVLYAQGLQVDTGSPGGLLSMTQGLQLSFGL